MWGAVDAQVFGGVLCPLLALEVRPMFQARGQAREKRDIKHREEETLVQACPCSLIADIEHHTWFFDSDMVSCLGRCGKANLWRVSSLREVVYKRTQQVARQCCTSLRALSKCS